MPERSPTRRVLVGAGLAAAATGGVLAMRKPNMGGAHDAYFSGLSAALAGAGLVRPTLVIDRARLDANVDAVARTLQARDLPVRIVVKSLPAHALIDRIAARLKTDRYMVFNAAMLVQMAQAKPRGDYLLGKPLPVAAVAQALKALSPDVSPHWLIDTGERLQQYAALARETGRPMRINLEIDVGLHRGGFGSAQAVAGAVDAARQASLIVTGLMGYDPHVPKMPDPERAYTATQKLYDAAKAVLQEKLGGDPRALVLNGAGSPTYALHAGGTAANEVAIGSAFVKPHDFDLKTLAHHTPACFIATPAIKVLSRAEIPLLEQAAGIFRFFDPNTAQAVFIHGGHWLATPVSPPGLQYSALFGRSSNQELLTGSEEVSLAPDDYVFLRPNQSEAVFLQFGDIAVYDGGGIVEMWPTFPVSA